MDESQLQLVDEIGNQLIRLTRTHKDALVKSLRQAANALSQIEQPSLVEESKKVEALKKLDSFTKYLRKSFIKHKLYAHSDKDVKLLVAVCVTELFRILAPEPPFEDKYLRDIFQLILSMFEELGDTSSPYFSKRVKILETVSRCKCCIIMLDIDCSDLVLKMFNIFFSVVRKDHQRSLVNDTLSIMTHILIEEPSQPLVDVILWNLLKDEKDEPSPASQLAVSLIQECADQLKPFICVFLAACSLDKDSVDNELKEFYHDILFKVFQCVPHMLLAVIPNLIKELMVDVRIKALNLIGRLFRLPEHRVAENYPNLFLEFKNRFFDKSVDVRLSALQCAKACYMANPYGKESHEVLCALEGRLLDFDDRVRKQALVIVCDLAKMNFKSFPPELILKVTERLRDKKLSVREKALQKLLELYREYCNKCSEGHMTICNHIEQIPCKVLILSYDKDCKEFRSHNLELILADNLFPASLSVEERINHWIRYFSLFTCVHEKALNIVLSQKRRLQTEMQIFLDGQEPGKECSLEEVEKKVENSVLKMSACFPDVSQAKECFNKLSKLKDASSIFSSLKLLLEEQTFVNAQKTRDQFLKIVGKNHPHYEFLSLLSSKCSFNIFGTEHVTFILNLMFSNAVDCNHLEDSAKLLLAIINNFPSLLRGSEEQFLMLLQENSIISNMLLEPLEKAAPYISNKFSDFYPFLEQKCLEGTRTQSKKAVSAIATFVHSSGHFVFSNLCKELMRSLKRGENIPTVLQCLSCVAQHSVSALESLYEDISLYIYESIFQAAESDGMISLDGSSECCSSCKLKIYGLKSLVKIFLPHRGPCINGKIDDKLLACLLKMLKMGEVAEGTVSCANGKMHIRLAAAKSVLRLSKRWDLHISPEIFCCTVMMAKDSSSFVRNTLLDKIVELWKERTLPSRYACTFALASSDCCKDVQDVLVKHMELFIKEYSRRAHVSQTHSAQDWSNMEDPAYIVVFLLYALAHDTSFIPSNSRDEHAYAQLCRPLFWLIQTLVTLRMIDGHMDKAHHALSYLHNVFRAIKKAEDASDTHGTSKLHILAEIGIAIVKSFNQDAISSHQANSSPQAPGFILLPSSFYKVNQKCLPQSHFDGNFLQAVVHVLKSQFSLPNSTQKRGRKFQGNDLQSSDVQNSKLNVATHKDTDKHPMKSTEKQAEGQVTTVGCRSKCSPSPEASESTSKDTDKHATCKNTDKHPVKSTEKQATAGEGTIVGCRSKCSPSPAESESLVYLNQCSFLELCRTQRSDGPNPLLEKGQLPSSHDTAATIPSLKDPKVVMSGITINARSYKENAGTSLGITAESSKSFKSKLKERCSSGETPLVESSRSVEEVETFGGGTEEKQENLRIKRSGKSLNSMPLLPGKAMKRRKDVSGSSTSEVIDGNEDSVAKRTRRQKALSNKQ